MKRETKYSKVERIIYTLEESDIRNIILKHLLLDDYHSQRKIDFEIVEVDGGDRGSSTQAIVTVNFESDDEREKDLTI